MRWKEKGRFEMLGHYTAIRTLQKQNLPLCLGTPESNRWGEPASIDFDGVLTTRYLHASAGESPV